MVASGLCGAAGCAALFDLDGLESGEAEPPDARSSETAPGTDSQDGAADAHDSSARDAGADADVGCPDGAGPSMILAGATCIDATEVTMGQYDAFLRSADASAFETGPCASNDVFEPGSLVVNPWPPPPPNFSLPMQGINYCAAAAYCLWAGKHLCGHLEKGHVLPLAEVTNPREAAWYFACSRGGTRTFPYGNVAADVCALKGTVTESAPVGSLHACEGGYEGLFDMAGNVEEWIDACDGAELDAGCAVQGGRYYSPRDQGMCQSFVVRRRTESGGGIGFRCCASPR